MSKLWSQGRHGWRLSVATCAVLVGSAALMGAPVMASATVMPSLSVSPGAGPVGSVVTVRFGPAGNGCGGVTFEAAGGGSQSLPFIGDSGTEAFLLPRVLGNVRVTPGRYVFSLTCDTTNNPATAITVRVPFTVTTSLPRTIVGIANTADGKGYWLVASDGGVFSFGDAHFYGSLPSDKIRPAGAIVGIAATHDHKGYWLVGADGGVFGFGDARFYGSAASQASTGVPIVGMATTRDAKGYWLAGAELSTFHLGDAKLLSLNSGNVAQVDQPTVGIAASLGIPQGYWQVTADGKIFAYGSAGSFGSMAGRPLTQAIVGIATNPATGGYWEVGADGGVFAFHAPFLGSTGNLHLNAPITAILSTTTGHGYRLVASDGGVFDFGDAHFYGSAA